MHKRRLISHIINFCALLLYQNKWCTKIHGMKVKHIFFAAFCKWPQVENSECLDQVDQTWDKIVYSATFSTTADAIYLKCKYMLLLVLEVIVQNWCFYFIPQNVPDQSSCRILVLLISHKGIAVSFWFLICR